MSVTINIDKPIDLEMLISELAGAGFYKTSSVPGQFITIDDTENMAAVMNVYAVHDPNRKTPQQVDQSAAVINYAIMPDWARTMNTTDAANYINGQIWSGVTLTQANAYIDATVKDLPGAIIAMKQIASAIIAMRGLFILTAQLLICIRDLTIRYR